MYIVKVAVFEQSTLHCDPDWGAIGWGEAERTAGQERWENWQHRRGNVS
jgi:hypothetical protein